MIRAIRIVVPARNEEDRVGACLDALKTAVAQLEPQRPIVVTIHVVLDCCTDDTEAAVRDRRGVLTVSCAAGRVGVARALGVQRALAAGHRISLRQTLIANTDADSRVPSDWLTSLVADMDRGAELVLGTVLPDDDMPMPARRRWLLAHRRGDGHPHVHGANLGIRADTYLRLGGFAPLDSGEDVALVERAVEAGTRITRSGASPVVTSARRVGRAPVGFAGYLSTLIAEGDAV